MRSRDNDGQEHPTMQLPVLDTPSLENPVMYTPSEESVRDMIGLTVFKPDGSSDNGSIYAESEKEAANAPDHTTHLCGCIPYYILAHAVAILVPFVALAIGLPLYFYLRSRNYTNFQESVYTQCSNRAAAIEKQISRSISAVDGVAVWLDMSLKQAPTKDLFYAAINLVTTGSMTNQSNVRAISYAPLVNDSSRAAWEKENNATIKQVLPNNVLVPAGKKPYYYPMQWTYPDSVNIIGFDIDSSPIRDAVLKKCVTTKEVAITGFIDLASTNETGYCEYFPVYANYPADTTTISGVISGCFGTYSTMEIALEGITDDLDHITVQDQYGVIGYDTNTTGVYDYTLTVTFNVLNDTWSISCFDTFQAQPFPAINLAIVLLIGIVSAIAVYACTQRYRHTSREAVLHKYRYNRSRHRASAVLQAVPDPLIVLNGEGRVVDCNKQAMDVFHVDRKSRFLGCHIKNMFVDANQVPLVRNNVVEPGLHEVLVRRHKNGDTFIAEANFSYVEKLNDDDNVPFLTQVVLLRDISAKKEAAMQLQMAKQEAEDANQRKSQFLAFACHELRNPLHVIAGMSDLLKPMVADEDGDKLEYVENIISSSNHMQNIVNDVLDIGQLSDNELRLHYQPLDFRKLLEEEGNMAQTLIPDKCGDDVNIVINVAESVPAYVNSDDTRIRQIIKNLIDNAVKFTEKGLITLEISASIDEARDTSISNVLFRVVDTGMRIPEDQLREMFQPFSTANISMGNHFGTSGVGLAIVHYLVNLMGGTLHIDNNINTGTVIEFTLPLALATEQDFSAYQLRADELSLVSPSVSAKRTTLRDAQSHGPSSWSVTSNLSNRLLGEQSINQPPLIINVDSPTPPVSLANAAKPELNSVGQGYESDQIVSPSSSLDSCQHSVSHKGHITADDVHELDIIEEKLVCLVVEDNEMCQKIAARLLGKDYVVEVADNGRIAVDTVMASPDRFSIIVMDIIMPEMDGLQATIELRKRGITCPIIAVTANAAEADKQEAMANGFTDYITKPYKRNLLVAMQQALDAAKQDNISSSL